MKKAHGILSLSLLLAYAVSVNAHDTWVQTNTNLARPGDVVHVNLMLGNHGNDHRDFKLAGKIGLDACTLSVVDGDGISTDLKSKLIDTGYAPKEGFWSARYPVKEAGLHSVVHTLDTLHHTTRAIKSSKTFFVASDSLDRVKTPKGGLDQPHGHPLELVLKTDLATGVAAGKPIQVQLLYQDKPLSDARVTFIPRGQSLEEGFDETYERMTDGQGLASFTPQDANFYLVVVHHREPEQKGEGYEQTAYSATLVLLVPPGVIGAR